MTAEVVEPDDPSGTETESVERNWPANGGGTAEANRPSSDVGEGEAAGEASTASTSSIVAAVELSHHALPFASTLEHLSGTRLVPEYTTTTPAGRPISYVTVSGTDHAAFESAVETDDTIERVTLLEGTPDRQVYRVTYTDAAIRLLPLTAAVEARVLDRSCSSFGWSLELHLPSREALIRFNERVRALNISFRVTHLRDAARRASRSVTLTHKQESLLTMAYERGYFDVPRGISQDELAEEIGVSKSAVSQRLRRALTGLCADSFSTPPS